MCYLASAGPSSTFGVTFVFVDALTLLRTPLRIAVLHIMPPTIDGPAAAALASLTQRQLAFIRSLRKAELHAHLNGSIPISTLQKLAENMAPDLSRQTSEAVQKGIDVLKNGVQLNAIGDFFGLFPAIYALTSTPDALREVTCDVLAVFLKGDPPEAAYLELRSTPRTSPSMTRRQYLEAVLDELEKYPVDTAALIVSVDRRMTPDEANECVELAIQLRNEGRRVVGIDLCGDPLVRSLYSYQRVHTNGTRL